MRYLILSDIHGNNVALEAVLDRVPSSRYDKILVLGDNIGDGPCPDKVLDILFDRSAIMIAGNREELARDHFNGFHETQKALQWDFMRKSLSFLNKEHLDFVNSSKNQRRIEEPQLAIRMVHGSPDSVRELLYYNNHNRLNECLDSIDEDILLCGQRQHGLAQVGVS